MSCNLVIYNLATDLDSDVLAAAHDWIYQLSDLYDQVIIFSTIVGRVELPSNCKVVPIGNKSKFSLIKIVVNYIKSIFIVESLPNKAHVFYHMNHKACLLLGSYYRARGHKQILWYSHSKKSLSLRVATLFVTKCVSTSLNTFPLKTRKLVPIGHGIDQNRFYFRDSNSGNLSIPHKIVASGRIVPIKRIEVMVDALVDSGFTLTLIGSQPNEIYANKLKQIALEKNVQIEFENPVSYEFANDCYSKFRFAINCTPISVDKAILEEAMCGCVPVSDNINVLNSTGMLDYWKESLGSVPELYLQISKLSKLESKQLSELAREISQITTERNGLATTAKKIYELFI